MHHLPQVVMKHAVSGMVLSAAHQRWKPVHHATALDSHVCEGVCAPLGGTIRKIAVSFSSAICCHLCQEHPFFFLPPWFCLEVGCPEWKD